MVLFVSLNIHHQGPRSWLRVGLMVQNWAEDPGFRVGPTVKALVGGLVLGHLRVAVMA